MRTRTTYTVTPQDALANADLPIQVEVQGLTVSVNRFKGGLQLVVERAVDRSALEVIADGTLSWRDAEGKKVPIPTLKVPESELDTVAARDVLSALSFLSDTTLRLSVQPPVDGDDVLPDDDEDEALLEQLGSRRRYRRIGGMPAMRTVQPNVDTRAVSALLDRASGVRIYAMALALGTSSGRFRELWRVLEAAFQLKDADLIEQLAQYGPATQLGFDLDELRELHTLRGRASHAESRSGVHELEHVERECAARLARLKCLAERVVLTKKSWGYRSTGVEELSPLLAYVRRDGGIVVRSSSRQGP